MKTKAYKLALELGIAEQGVLDWLRVNGYPNVRRGDTIRAEVVVAARRALGRPGAGPQVTDSQTLSARAVAPRAEATTLPPQRPSGEQRLTRTSDGFRVSFAQLLEEHLPQGLSEAVAVSPNPPLAPQARPSVPPSRPTPRVSSGAAIAQDDVLKLRLARSEADREQAHRELDILRQRLEADQTRLAAARAALDGLDAERQVLALLRLEHDRVLLERATVRQTLQSALDERGTLEQTCAELQNEVAELRDALRSANGDREARDAMVGTLESTLQREVAWRARALELERAVQTGNSLPTLLQGFGLEDLRQQADVLRALLADRDGALGLIRAIRQVDAAAISKLVAGRVARVCAHPTCDDVARIDERLRIRVDDATRCDICQDSSDRRWFARLVRECTRAGTRRLLVIGCSEKAQALLRDLSQGQPVDLRLVSELEAAPPARVRGRVESCDVLVIGRGVPAEIAEAYAQAAEAEGRPVVHVLGDKASVADLARAVSIRLARNHILVAS